MPTPPRSTSTPEFPQSTFRPFRLKPCSPSHADIRSDTNAENTRQIPNGSGSGSETKQSSKTYSSKTALAPWNPAHAPLALGLFDVLFSGFVNLRHN